MEILILDPLDSFVRVPPCRPLPLFMRMEILHALRPLPRWESLGKLRRLTALLMELPEVAGAVTADFPDRLRNYISERGSLFLRTA